MARLKNIQVIDGALNCTYSIFQATAAEFRSIFPGKGQDMEFASTFVRRVGEVRARKIMDPIWNRPIAKKDAVGIHGTLFYEFEDRKRYFPRSKREKDWGAGAYNQAQRRLFGLK